ncbi:cobalt-zinc-cadmium efflux system membrane fusion protein [Rheinheimera pacifica]|uniref:efflux RND transporter periplasmic adaptor subunit n=1 Tax=Rheinheimera pacifica TaxID=173990 RepID=UPI0028555438|nr:efflux RND transporter periplasmic adaptor subunit [Rheinheimera pacifica]MDR6982573.1 cobalt-zinc-cadmium efflux system membrane fusion protein [Rheinheimera pacifica]
MQKITVKRLKTPRLSVVIWLVLLATHLLSLQTNAAAELHGNHGSAQAQNNSRHDKHDDNHDHDHGSEEHGDEHKHSDEPPLKISGRMLTLNQISTETAAAITLVQKIHLYGVIAAVPEQQAAVKAPYAAVLDKVLVKQGDHVSKGQLLANLTNLSSLKTYQLRAPLVGVVTRRYLNDGELIRDETLLDIANYSKVYAELSAFPSDIALLQPDMPVHVFSLHQAKVAHGTISYISAQMTEGHIARTRALINNDDGYWRPGMHIKADIHIANIAVAVAVKKNALQRIDNQPAVFVRHGDSFEVHKLTLGREDDDYIEVLSGLEAGSEYASANSFVLKADLLKSGASHEH